MPFLGEIRLFAFGTAPTGWHICDGSLITITSNTTALLSLLGTQFGGNGTTNFALPDLRGRVPIGGGIFAAKDGAETVTLTTENVPAHSHPIYALNKTASSITAVSGTVPQMLAVSQPETGGTGPRPIYGSAGSLVSLDSQTISEQGSTQAHNNMQPFAVVNFCICVSGGEYPSRN
jgi:microcystin-dependent protein